MIDLHQQLKLYLVTDGRITSDASLLHVLEDALIGGVTTVQLREKDSTVRDFARRARRVRELTSRYKVPLIINDRVDVALAIGAEGVHLGQQDLSVIDARRIVGPDMIIGVSTATLEEALIAETEGADYLGVGALYPTGTKTNTRPVTPDTLRRITSRVRIPVVAIGGIHHENVSPVVRCKVDGVAVVSAIAKAAAPREAARRFIETIDEIRRNL